MYSNPYQFTAGEDRAQGLHSQLGQEPHGGNGSTAGGLHGVDIVAAPRYPCRRGQGRGPDDRRRRHRQGPRAWPARTAAAGEDRAARVERMAGKERARGRRAAGKQRDDAGR